MRAWPFGTSLNPRITDWNGQRVWIIGASSGIGAALAQALYTRGARLALSARRERSLAELASSLQASAPGVTPLTLPLDVTDFAALQTQSAALLQAWGGIDYVFCVAGIYQPMRAQTWDAPAARRILQTNLVAVYDTLSLIVPQMLQQGHGGVALVASVAGYRGLPQALVYGPTKAALINLAESLYFDVHPAGLGVYLINPGFVATPATARNTHPMPALISAAEAAQHTLAGMAQGRFDIHYPKRFTCWLKFMRLLPARWYFALIRRVTGL